MKTFLKKQIQAGLLIVVLVFTSCQTAPLDTNPNTTQAGIRLNSPLVGLIKKTSAHDGSFDNIVDNSSCISIRFPYVVKVNGMELLMELQEDLGLVEDAFNASQLGEDSLEIVYPITVIRPDHSQIVLEYREELDALAEDCVEGGDDDDIECIDFTYPMTWFTLDQNNLQMGSVNVENDLQLRAFFLGLDGDDLVSLQYPVVLVDHEGAEVEVDNNAALAAALEMAENSCNENDNG